MRFGLKKLCDFVLELIYPTKCAFCHKLTPNHEEACSACMAALPFTKGNLVEQKLTHIPRCVSPLCYKDDVRASLHRYKFGGINAYAKVYAKFMQKCIDENDISCDIITWVPLSRKRLRKRGYDQARLLAEELGKLSGIKVERLLVKVKDNPAQSGTGSPKKRKANVKGVYRVHNEQAFASKRILLVDDIVTTGSTLSECALILVNAGAKEVSAVTVARTVKE